MKQRHETQEQKRANSRAAHTSTKKAGEDTYAKLFKSIQFLQTELVKPLSETQRNNHIKETIALLNEYYGYIHQFGLAEIFSSEPFNMLFPLMISLFLYEITNL